MFRVDAFAFEHSEVAAVHAIESKLGSLSFSVIAPASDERLSAGKSLSHARMKDNFDGSALSRAGDAVIGGP